MTFVKEIEVFRCVENDTLKKENLHEALNFIKENLGEVTEIECKTDSKGNPYKEIAYIDCFNNLTKTLFYDGCVWVFDKSISKTLLALYDEETFQNRYFGFFIK